MRGWIPWLLVAALGCGDDPEQWDEGRPRVDRLQLLQQSPQDPLALEIQVSFEDSDGDLGAGKVELFVDEQRTAELSMSEVFAQQTPRLALDAKEGQIELIVRLVDEVAIGDRLKIGVVLEDGRGHRSNEPYFEVEAF